MAIEERLVGILDTIRRACAKKGRDPSTVSLVAVTKTKSVLEMGEYAAAAGRLSLPIIFGENYVQEMKEKRAHLPAGSELHMIGPLQSNKIRDAVTLCDVIESVHSLKTIQVIAKEAARLGKRQRMLIQVNIGRDEQKSGFLPEELEGALAVCEQNAERLMLEGLMTLLPYDPDPEKSRPYFKNMEQLRARLINHGFSRCFESGIIRLSMGMSDDFAIAIEEGADLVRIGTALFGHRS